MSAHALARAGTPLPARGRAGGAVDLPSLLGLSGTSSLLVRTVALSRARGGAKQLRDDAVVVEGAVLSTITIGRRTASVLYGPGDVLPGMDSEPDPFGPVLRALQPSRVAPLDSLNPGVLVDPAIATALAERVQRKTNELVLQAILTQLASIGERLEMLLPHLSERWGTVTRDGVLLPGFLSHSVLASLIGVRRPSLTTALGELTPAGRMVRLPDRRWLVSRALAGL